MILMAISFYYMEITIIQLNLAYWTLMYVDMWVFVTFKDHFLILQWYPTMQHSKNKVFQRLKYYR